MNNARRKPQLMTKLTKRDAEEVTEKMVLMVQPEDQSDYAADGWASPVYWNDETAPSVVLQACM